MINEIDIFEVCYGTYKDEFVWDFVFKGNDDCEVFVGVKKIDEVNVVAFRGSVTVMDWVRNFEAFPVFRDGLGWIADGFLYGMDEIVEKLIEVVGSNWVVTGHSRGAAQGTIFSALMTLLGKAPNGLYLFAPPRTGGSTLKKVLSEIKEIKAYGNKNDPVLELPFWEWHPYEIIEINQPPKENDPWGLIAPHRAELYGEWIKDNCK